MSGRPATSSAAVGLISSSRVKVSRSGRTRRSSRHQRSKWAPEMTESGIARGVEVVERLVVDEDVAPAGALLERLDFLHELLVLREEAMPRVPLALDQRAADEQVTAQRLVDPPVRDGAAGDDRQPVERHALGGDDLGALALPARLLVRALDQVAGQGLDPARVDPGDGPAPQPRRLDQLGGHHPGRLALHAGARPQREARVARADVLAAAGVLEPDVREQSGQDRLVDLLRLGRRVVDLDADLLRRLPQLPDEVLPLADPQVVQELALGLLAELVDGQLGALLVQVAPQVQVGEEVGGVVGVAGVRLVGLLLLVGGPLADVLDRQRGRDHDHFVDAAHARRLEHHPAHPRVDRELREPPAELRQLAARLVERAQLLQQRDAVAHLAPVRRVEEREVLDVAEVDRRHLQDHCGEARAQDLGFGEARPLLEVLLAVEPDRDPLGDAPAAALALVGARLADRLDRQPLDLQPRAVAADPRGARVDDVVDAGHGQRRLGNVRREHDAAALVGLPHALLGGGGLPREQRKDLDARAQPAFERIRGVADLALARQEDEDVAGPFAQQLLDRIPDGVGLVGVLVRRPVAHLDRIGAAGDLDDRRVVEVRAEPLGIDRRAGDDDLQVRPPGQDPLQVAEQEIDVQAPLVRLVDDDRVVAAQQPVVLDLGQQQTVGHEPQQRVLARAVAEPHRVADRASECDLQLVGDPFRDRPRREPSRLRVPDRAAHPAAEFEAHLRDLRRLARAGLAGDDHDLVVPDRGEQVLAARADRQLLGVGDGRHGGLAALESLRGSLDVTVQPLAGLRVVFGQALTPAGEPVLVLDRQLWKACCGHVSEARPAAITAGIEGEGPFRVGCIGFVRRG